MSDNLKELFAMLEYKRPAYSETDDAFIERFLAPLGVEQDHAGNVIKRIGDSSVCWSCHTDTVHSIEGTQGLVIKKTHVMSQDKSCLGADDTAGVWLMSELIKAGKPGLYIFHRGEERGGIGSEWIAENNKEMFDGIKCAIALDRMGTTSVITHQGTRCCSDKFAQSLANQLHGYKLDTGGLFTDTANYTDYISECTNLSVGYFSQHTSNENLNFNFLRHLRGMLLRLNYDNFVYERVPGTREYKNWYNYGGYGSRHSNFRYDDYGHEYGGGMGAGENDWYDKYVPEKASQKEKPEGAPYKIQVEKGSEIGKLATFLKENAEYSATIMNEFYGMTEEALRAFLSK